MNEKEKTFTVICVILVFAVVVGLIIWGVRNKDTFCGACSNIGLQVNTDRALLSKLYNSGQLTENSKLERGDKWKVGSYVGSQFTQYPVSNARTCS